MSCIICKLRNAKLRELIEQGLEKGEGSISQADLNTLKNEFPDEESLDALTAQQSRIHWNFHQTIKREAVVAVVEEAAEEAPSLTKDVNKDEANVLYELLNNQAATFNLLSKKINGAIEQHNNELNNMIINPNTIQFYKETADSIRSTVRELRELNASVNGAKDGATEGLKALAAALSPKRADQNDMTEPKDLTTDMYD